MTRTHNVSASSVALLSLIRGHEEITQSVTEPDNVLV